MTALKQDSWLVYLQFAILLGIVALADRPLIRVALAFVVGLLLVQRAVGALGGGGPAASQDRRQDPEVRDAVSQLLERVRDFYATCHLARSGQIPTDEAMARTKKIDKDLNALLEGFIRVSRGEPMPGAAQE